MNFAVIFDMDGVMVDNGEFHYKAWKQFCKNYNIGFSKEKFQKVFFGRTNNQVIPALFSDTTDSGKIQKLANEKESIYRQIYKPHIKPVSGLVSFLKELKTKSIPVAVATSAPKENVDFVLQALNIQKYIDVVVDDTLVSKGKPNPEIYLLAAKLLRAEPTDCIVFEDSLSGTKAAFEAGTKVIALTTTLAAETHRFAHEIINDFTSVFIAENEIKIKE
jgi:beta-phosphoglucomutase family hydrolase